MWQRENSNLKLELELYFRSFGKFCRYRSFIRKNSKQSCNNKKVDNLIEKIGGIVEI